MSTPPVELVERVVGTDDVEAYERSGFELVDQLRELLSRAGYDLEQFRDIYDFGSGPGRLARALHERLPETRVTATDIDEEAIAWLSENAPGIDVRATSWLPPLPFDDGAFDLVIVISVFTHLPADYQDAWLAELRRVTRPGGVVIATVHGEAHWRHTWEVGFKSARRRVRLRAKALALERRLRGFAYWRGDGWERVFPDYYHTTWHRPTYVRRHWSRWFDVVRHEEAGVPGTHDFVVLSAR